MKLILALLIAALVVINAPVNKSGQHAASVNKTTAVPKVSAPLVSETVQPAAQGGGEVLQPEVAKATVANPQPLPEPQVTQATGCEKYRDIIDNYSWNVDVAIAVCNAESSGNAATSNLNDYHTFANCRGSFGLFQINCSHGVVHDPVENIRIAAAMYDASGWKPWSFTTCKYKVSCY